MTLAKSIWLFLIVQIVQMLSFCIWPGFVWTGWYCFASVHSLSFLNDTVVGITKAEVGQNISLHLTPNGHSQEKGRKMCFSKRLFDRSKCMFLFLLKLFIA
jgi:ABC-type sugar transport system permease subunit